MWMTGTYDPDLNLRLRRHRQSDAGAERSGASRRQPLDLQHRRAQSRIPASWRGASRRRRTTRTTGTRPKCRCSSTADFDGAPRKLLLQASRNGYFFVLDRTNGKNLLTTPFAAVNWAKGIDEDGRPIPEPGQGAGARRPAGRAERGRRHELSIAELRSRRPACFIVSAQDAYGIYFFKPEHGDVRLGGRRLRRLEQGRAAGDRLPDRQDPLEPRSRRRRAGRRRADDGDRA